MLKAIDFVNLLLASLLAGTMFGAWLMFNPAGVAAERYLAVQQQGIRRLHPAVPALGALTIAVTLLAALLGRDDRTRATLLVLAALCFVTAGVVTRFKNMPINAVVIQWTADSMPTNWTDLRDSWWFWHCVRLIAGLAGLVLVTVVRLLD